MSAPLHILIVEDSEDDALLVIDELRDGGYETEYERVETRKQMEEALERQDWDVIIADYRLPDLDGLQALQIACESPDICPFIIISGQISEETAVEAMRAGAKDYILKGNLRRLVPAVERELREAEVRRQRREVEEELQAERDRSHSILESITDGFYALDKDWRFTYVNSAAERILGRDWRSLKGSALWEVFPHAATLPVHDELRRAMAERVPVTIERYYDRLDVWHIIRAYPYADGLAVYVRDITAQKRAEEEIRRREELLQTIQNSLSAQIAVLDSTGAIIAVNEAWKEVARANGDLDLARTGVGMNYLDVCRNSAALGDEKAGEVLTGIESVLGKRTSYFETEYPLTCQDEQRWFYMRVTPLRSEKGGAVVAHMDITQRVMAEQRLRESEEHYRTLFDAIDEGFCIVEMIFDENDRPVDYRFLETNPAFERQTGLVHARGRRMRELAPKHEEHWFQIYGEIALTGEPVRFENRAEQLGRWYDVYAFRFGQPEKRQVAILFSDITERRNTHNQLQDALERERRFSLLLQRALLPEKPSINHGYDVAVEYIPYYVEREIGGDFYDVFEVAGGKAGIVIGDVSGKGLEAAALAAAARSTIHALVHETGSAGESLARANSILCKGHPDFETQFVTVFVTVIDLETGELNYASAGHPPGAVRRGDGDVQFLRPNFRPPVCLVSEVAYPESRDRLDPGDALILFTDGIAEARRNGELFDLEGIAQTLKEHGHLPVDAIAAELTAAATDWAEGHLSDDAAVVVIRRQEQAADGPGA